MKEAISATRASKTIGLGKWQPTRPFLATFRTELLEAITTSNRKRSEQPTTHVLRRVEKLLSAVASRIEPSTLSELADETGIHSSTAYRLLSDMVTNRLLERTNRGTFKLGLYLLVLANLVKIRASMHGAALPAMSHLHARIGHSVYFSVRQDDFVVCTERVPAESYGVQMVRSIGEHTPLHLTPSGKIFLAHLGESEIQEFLSRSQRHVPRNCEAQCSLPLAEQLKDIRENSIAVGHEEHEPNIVSAACAVRNRGEVVATLSFSAPRAVMKYDWCEWLREAADEVRTALEA